MFCEGNVRGVKAKSARLYLLSFCVMAACQGSNSALRDAGTDDLGDAGSGLGSGGSVVGGANAGGAVAGGNASGGNAASGGGGTSNVGGNGGAAAGGSGGTSNVGGNGGMAGGSGGTSNVGGNGGTAAGSGGTSNVGGNGGTAAGGSGGTSTGSGGASGTRSPAAAWWAAGPRTKARVFFSGHSLMDNPIPDFVAQIAQSLGHDFKFNQQIGIGSPILARTGEEPPWPGYRTGKNREGQGMNVIAELKDPKTLDPGDKYDVLLITERHDILGTIEWVQTARALQHYHDRLIDGSMTATTIFTQTWLDIDKDNPAQWIAHEKTAKYAWECVASKINLALAGGGRSDRVVPQAGGAALVVLVEKILAGQVKGIGGTTRQRMDALFSDFVHPTILGSYFMAAVHYATIFRRSPVGAAPPPNVPAEPVPDLQRIAWEFVSAYYSGTNAGDHTMEQCRTLVSETVCPTFWTLLKGEDKINGCKGFFSNPAKENNPFRWPDPFLKPFSAP